MASANESPSHLSERANEQIFQSEILPYFLRSERGLALPTDKTIVVLGGQPGSGKTGLLAATHREISSQGATWTINGDDFYSFHPAYRDLQKRYGAEAAVMVKEEASAWVSKTLKAARERGVNVVLESTMRRGEVVQDTLHQFSQAGYRTHAKVLAVREQASWQGNVMRYELLAMQGAYPRLTTRDIHDEGVKNLPKTVALLERKALAERITVHQRNGKLLYDSGKQRSPVAGKAVDALLKEWARPWTTAEVARHAKNWTAVETFVAERHQREATTPKRAAMELAAVKTQRNADERSLKESSKARGVER